MVGNDWWDNPEVRRRLLGMDPDPDPVHAGNPGDKPVCGAEGETSADLEAINCEACRTAMKWWVRGWKAGQKAASSVT